ncbi:hypothetical protein M1D34_30055 (plasmid) [Ensifer sp. D2-11]
MAGDALIDIDDASPSDRTVLIAIYLSGHAQAAVPSPVDLSVIESTVDANLMLSSASPRDLISLKAVVDTSVAGAGLARRRRDGRYSVEIIVGATWLRRGIAKSLLFELNTRCRDLGAIETCAHIYKDNWASIALVESVGSHSSADWKAEKCSNS